MENRERGRRDVRSERQPEDGLCVTVGEVVGERRAWREGERLPERLRERDGEGPL